MKVLIDTHIALWALEDSPKLPRKAREILLDEENEIFYSVASVWEVAIKHQNHPIAFPENEQRFANGCNNNGFVALPIVAKHIFSIKTLKRSENAPQHKDPFDRLLLAQAKSEGMALLTHDSLIPDYNESFIISV